jgi:hypothetical protein
MTNLEAHKKDLYQLRFSPMCKPAAEVANLTQLESHTTRARAIMLWRIAEGIANWGPREVDLLYESTLDSISEAFDVFHYPISQMMLDARADVWEAGLAPECVKQVVEASAAKVTAEPPAVSRGGALLLAGEIAQLDEGGLLAPLSSALESAGIDAPVWVAESGALAYGLGARDVARAQADQICKGIQSSGAQTVIADGPETAWGLTRIYPALGVNLPGGVSVELLSEALSKQLTPPSRDLGRVFVHDSRPACLIAERAPGHLAVLPGYVEDEAVFGEGPVYEAPRQLVDLMGGERVYGVWTRALAKTSGADDGLWLTYPHLAAGLASQRLDYPRGLGATELVTDSPLAATYLARNRQAGDIPVRWLPELLAGEEDGEF